MIDRQIAIRVPHADGFGAAAEALGDALCLKPRQRRIPRDVHVPPHVGLDLSFVVRKQHVVELETAGAKVLLETVPDGHDLLVVRHGAHDQRIRCARCLQ